jgi:hypothetical protein
LHPKTTRDDAWKGCDEHADGKGEGRRRVVLHPKTTRRHVEERAMCRGKGRGATCCILRQRETTYGSACDERAEGSASEVEAWRRRAWRRAMTRRRAFNDASKSVQRRVEERATTRRRVWRGVEGRAMTRRKSVIEIGAACKTRGRACNDAWKSDERAEGRGEGRRVAAVASQDDETTNGKACDERAEGRGEGRRVASQNDETTN